MSLGIIFTVLGGIGIFASLIFLAVNNIICYKKKKALLEEGFEIDDGRIRSKR